ncbi:MAG: hypothetical protein ACTSUC_19565 [Promethearchaeota archaeon]
MATRASDIQEHILTLEKLSVSIACWRTSGFSPLLQPISSTSIARRVRLLL